MLKVTTSWDDGCKLDNRVAALLDKYGLKGTFYISKNYIKDRLSEEDIFLLSRKHEIGAHTITHPNLTEVQSEKVRREIIDSKEWLEGVIKTDIKTFCYPSGKLNKDVVKLVKEAGFKIARTVKKYHIGKIENPYLMNTTIHIYPFPLRKKNKTHYFFRYLLQPFQQNFRGLLKLGVPITSFRGWLPMAKSVFEISLEKGETFHLWGHSWEIEKYGMWGELEEFLKHISNRSDCLYLVNSDIIAK